MITRLRDVVLMNNTIASKYWNSNVKGIKNHKSKYYSSRARAVSRRVFLCLTNLVTESNWIYLPHNEFLYDEKIHKGDVNHFGGGSRGNLFFCSTGFGAAQSGHSIFVSMPLEVLWGPWSCENTVHRRTMNSNHMNKKFTKEN